LQLMIFIIISLCRCSYVKKGDGQDNPYLSNSLPSSSSIGSGKDDTSIVTSLPPLPSSPLSGLGVSPDFDNIFNHRMLTSGSNVSCLDIVKPSSTWPFNDEYFPCKWEIGNYGQKVPQKLPWVTGASFYQKGYTGADLNLLEVYKNPAWSNFRGKDINIHLTDSGIDINHEDLKDNVLLSESKNLCQNGGNNPTPQNDSDSEFSSGAAHGSGVAGIMAAVANNQKGIPGIAYQATISGDNAISYCRDYASIPDWVNILSSKGAKIWNGSFGTNKTSTTYSSATDGYDILNWAMEMAAKENNKLFFKAAGNEGYSYKEGDANRDPFARGEYNFIIGALDAMGRPEVYTNPGSNVFISAFGGNGASNRAGITTLALDQKYTTNFNGTSASTPQVAGVAALLLSAHPALRPIDIQYILARTATPIDAPELPWSTKQGTVAITHTSVNAAGFWFNRYVGFGLVDAFKAMQLATSPNYKILPALEKYPQLLKTGTKPIKVVANKTCGIKKITAPSQILFQVLNAHISFDIRFENYEEGKDKLGNLSVVLVAPDGTRFQVIAPSKLLEGSHYTHGQPHMLRFLLGTMAAGDYYVEVCAHNPLRDTPFLFYSAQLKLSGFKSKIMPTKQDPI